MKIKIFNKIDEHDAEQVIDKWLNEVGPIHISHTQILVSGNQRKMFVFYEPAHEATEAKPRPARSKEALCRQCKKNPSIPGQKQCEACRQYQSDYRKQRKEEKKVRYP